MTTSLCFPVLFDGAAVNRDLKYYSKKSGPPRFLEYQSDCEICDTVVAV